MKLLATLTSLVTLTAYALPEMHFEGPKGEDFFVFDFGLNELRRDVGIGWEMIPLTKIRESQNHIDFRTPQGMELFITRYGNGSYAMHIDFPGGEHKEKIAVDRDSVLLERITIYRRGGPQYLYLAPDSQRVGIPHHQLFPFLYD